MGVVAQVFKQARRVLPTRFVPRWGHVSAAGTAARRSGTVDGADTHDSGTLRQQGLFQSLLLRNPYADQTTNGQGSRQLADMTRLRSLLSVGPYCGDTGMDSNDNSVPIPHHELPIKTSNLFRV